MRRGRWALLAAAWAAGAHAFLGLPQKRFKEDALIDAGALGLDALHGHIAAWSYADADRYVDAVVVDADRQEARVHRWEHAAFRFASEPMASVRVPDTLRIANVVPADLTYDGRADLLVMAEPRTPSAAEPLTLLLYAQQANGTYGAPQTLPPAMAPQPLLVDASGTLQGDLLGHAAHDPSRLVLWRRDADTGAYTLEDLVMHGDVPPCTLGHPHSSAHVDLDGDCLADLFLVCANHAYQIWTARADEPRTYDLARAGDLPPGAGPLAFADMNRDGTMDVVFATCDRQRCDLVIAYNEQMPLCEREKRGMLSWPNMTAPARCRDEMQMCTRDVQFRLDLSEDSELLARLPLDALTGDAALLQYDEIGTLTRPVGVRVGDYNRDGYPDVALLTVPARAPPGRTRVHLLESTPCVRRGAPGCADAPVARRSFQRLGGTVLDALEYVRHIAFLDLDEDGTLDLVLQSLPPLAARTTDARAVSFVQNNYFHDAFFLRAVSTYPRVRADRSSAQRRLRPPLRAGRRPPLCAVGRRARRRVVQVQRARPERRAPRPARYVARASSPSRTAAADRLRRDAAADGVRRPRPHEQLHRVAVRRQHAPRRRAARARGRHPQQPGRPQPVRPGPRRVAQGTVPAPRRLDPARDAHAVWPHYAAWRHRLDARRAREARGRARAPARRARHQL